MTVWSLHEPWIVVNTHPHKEDFAILNLRQQGMQVYCPMILRRIRHARRAYDAPRPLFPSYVFVRRNSVEGRWQVIRSSLGVRSVISSGHDPGLIDGQFVDRLREREVDGTVRKPDQALSPGQDVVICGGPMDGLIARILDLRSKERVFVLMELLNQPVRATVNVDRVRPVS